MTAEQRRQKMTEVNRELVEKKKEFEKLVKEDILARQQECLQWVGRAFAGQGTMYLITSVPPIEYSAQGVKFFNEYQVPCIKIPSDESKPPIFDETLYLEVREMGNMTEIDFSDFQTALNKRINYLLMQALTAKVRQQGKEVIRLREGEILEENRT